MKPNPADKGQLKDVKTCGTILISSWPSEKNGIW